MSILEIEDDALLKRRLAGMDKIAQAVMAREHPERDRLQMAYRLRAERLSREREEAAKAQEVEEGRGERERKRRRILDRMLVKLGVEATPVSSLDMVLRAIADEAGVTVEDLKSGSRAKRFADARIKAYYEVAKRFPTLSYPSIARIFRRDHTTIMHGIVRHIVEGAPPIRGLSEECLGLRKKIQGQRRARCHGDTSGWPGLCDDISGH